MPVTMRRKPRQKGGFKRRPRGRKQPRDKKIVRKYTGRVRAPLKYNVELFQWEVSPTFHNMAPNSASAVNGPLNTYCMYPAGFSALTTNQSARGNFICPKYLKSKLSIGFMDLTTHADTFGLICKVYHGRVKVTMAKLTSLHASSQAAFAAEVDAVVKRELFDSEFSSAFLDFTQKNRNLIIDGKWTVRPNQDHIAHGTSAWVAPDKQYNINHRVPGIKTRVEPATGVHAEPLLVNMWLPFIAVECHKLTSNTGTLKIGYSSKLYFSDM